MKMDVYLLKSANQPANDVLFRKTKHNSGTL
jgi:hypothetical protein